MFVGLGIVSLFVFLCKCDLVEGCLIEVMLGWNSGGIDYFVVFSDFKIVLVWVWMLIDFFVEWL